MISKYRKIIRHNSLSIVLLGLFGLTLIGLSIVGQRAYNEEAAMHGQPAIGFGKYLVNHHFLEAVFENWESEFLQMAAFIVLTVFLVQRGSSESKPLQGDARLSRRPDPSRPDVPKPVKQGGLGLKLYENSLTIVLTLLFLASFVMHGWSGWQEYCSALQSHQQSCGSFFGYFGSNLFWFESLQNWQSEFFSVGVLIILSIFLRQKGSPQSKPVDAPHGQTGA